MKKLSTLSTLVKQLKLVKTSRLSITALMSATALFGCTDNVIQSSTDVVESSVIESKTKQPNVILILADDLGYGDISPYGSEIDTPNLEELANKGLKMTNFHVGAACSPTRTMLMTGVDNHLAGLGNMFEIQADNQFGKKGYEGQLNKEVITLSSALKDQGYNSYMVGKWHLGKNEENKPSNRGFERSFVLLESGADNWVDQSYGPMYDKVHYLDDGKPTTLPKEGYFSTDFYTDKMISYIEENRKSGKPFFSYVAYQAVHSPHQAPLEYVEKYNGTYDKGWDEQRKIRIANQKKLGIIDKTVELKEDFSDSTMYKTSKWDSHSVKEKEFHARRMQVYAGMVDNMDVNIGRLMAYLGSIGEADNTVIIFMSDNGADATELQNIPPYEPWYRGNYAYTYPSEMTEGLVELGQKESFSAYGPGWAAVSNTPTSYWKTYSSEGGVRSPFIIYYPAKIKAGQLTNEFAYVKDILPTILEISGTTVAEAYASKENIIQPAGKSMMPLFSGDSTKVHGSDSMVGYELAGSSALFNGNLKIVKNLAPKGDGNWKLYDIVKDPGEVNNLALAMPEQLTLMVKAYVEYAKTNNVIPVPDGYDPRVQLMKNAKRAH
jgi:arylsulfatase